MSMKYEDCHDHFGNPIEPEPESCPECGAWMYEIRGEPGLWACPSCGNEEYCL